MMINNKDITYIFFYESKDESPIDYVNVITTNSLDQRKDDITQALNVLKYHAGFNTDTMLLLMKVSEAFA